MPSLQTSLDTTIAHAPLRVRLANAAFIVGLISADWGVVSPEKRRFVLDRDGHCCLRCGATERLEMDHIRPYRDGGWTVPRNLQTLCKPCNCWKGARYADYRRSLKNAAQLYAR